MVSKIWVEMSTANIHLLQFTIQSHLQKRRLWMPVHQNSFQRQNVINLLHYIRHFVFCASKYLHFITTLSTLESTFLYETTRHASRWLILAQRIQNLEFVKCVTYVQTISFPLKTPHTRTHIFWHPTFLLLQSIRLKFLIN